MTFFVTLATSSGPSAPPTTSSTSIINWRQTPTPRGLKIGKALHLKCLHMTTTRMHRHGPSSSSSTHPTAFQPEGNCNKTPTPSTFSHPLNSNIWSTTSCLWEPLSPKRFVGAKKRWRICTYGVIEGWAFQQGISSYTCSNITSFSSFSSFFKKITNNKLKIIKM